MADQSEGSHDSIKQLLDELKRCEPTAADELTRRYFNRVVAAASARLRSQGIRVIDGEDIAASVFESLWHLAADQRFTSSELQSADDLWRLLCRLMRSKTIDALRRERAQKRGGGKVRGESAFLVAGSDEQGGLDLDDGGAQQPIEAAALAECYSLLMHALRSDQIREIVTLRLEGYDSAEIASRVDLSERSVRRKIEVARSVWSQIDQSRV